MKTEVMSFSRSIDIRRNHPNRDRMAVRSVSNSHDVAIGTWSNRSAMAQSIRMQEQRASKPTDWKAIVPLTDLEGF